MSAVANAQQAQKIASQPLPMPVGDNQTQGQQGQSQVGQQEPAQESQPDNTADTNSQEG